MEKFETEIRFGGFYESIHGFYAYDSELDYMKSLIPDEFVNDLYDCINYSETRLNYSRKLISEKYKPFYEKLFEKLTGKKITDSIEFKELFSPREYNFRTDEIVVNISPEMVKVFYEDALKVKEEFNKYLIENLSSSSGFNSFYDHGLENDNWQIPFENWLETSYNVTIILEFMLDKYKEDELFEDLQLDCLYLDEFDDIEINDNYQKLYFLLPDLTNYEQGSKDYKKTKKEIKKELKKIKNLQQ